MSGPDTARGINFQYACAIGLILDFPLHPNWQVIQMEGDEDIEDVKILDRDTQVVFRAQIKQKRDPHQWQPHELRDVFIALSECPDSDETQYQFIYAGSEGKTVVNESKPILLKLHYEGWEALAPSEVETLNSTFGDRVVEFLSRVEDRLTLVKRETWESIKAHDLRRLRKLLSQGRSSHLLEEDYEVGVYNNLLREVAQKTEGEVKYFRRLTREQVYELLQIEESLTAKSALDIPQYIQWIKTTAEKWFPIVTLTLQKETAVPDILSLIVRVESESTLTKSDISLSVLDVIKQFQQIALVGEPGSGKTVSLWQLALYQCESLEEASLQEDGSTPIPVYISLAGYAGEPVDDLVSQSFHETGQMVTGDAIHDLARQGRLMLLLDDFDLAKTRHLPDLLLRLKNWSVLHRRCSIVVATHCPSDGHNLRLPTFRLSPLDWKQAQQILLELPGIDQGDALAILNGLPADSKHLTTSPLTLRMIAYSYIHSDHRVPQSRSPLYQEVIKGILALSEKKGVIEFDRSDKVNLLALVARWMQNNETYVMSPARISALIGGWIRDDNDRFHLAHLRSCDQLRLRTELIQSGLLRITPDGDVEFIHPTFRAYLAALTISIDELSALVDESGWHTSLILWASLRDRHETDALIDLTPQYPVLLGQLIRERAEKRGEATLNQAELKMYFEQLQRFFGEFVKQFPVLLQDPPWKSLTGNGLELVVAQSSVTNGYTLTWQSAKDSTSSTIKWTTCKDLHELAASRGNGLPLPIYLLPEMTMQKYHPLEVVYLWVMRSLFDLLTFAGWVGGLDMTEFRSQTTSHPAIALVANRFLFYQEFASKLPQEIRDQLPLYAGKEYDLVIEVHEYINPVMVRYAVATAQRPGNISVVQSILRGANETPLFGQDENGNWYFCQGDQMRRVSAVEEVDIGHLMMISPAFEGQKWVKNDLERYLPSFPPQAW